MQNFTEIIKSEITKKAVNKKLAYAILSAFIRTSGSIFSRNGCYGFEIVTEHEFIAEYFYKIFTKNLSFIVDDILYACDETLGRKKFILKYCGEDSQIALTKLGILKQVKGEVLLNLSISDQYFESMDLLSAYVRGAFLGGGSCTVPDEESYSTTGYHFEIVFSNKTTANAFCELLCELDIFTKMVIRKDNVVIYVKSKEIISDLLHLIDLPKSLDRLNKISAYKNMVNNENRVNNCTISNIDKTLTASVNQVQAIEILRQTIGLKRLNERLFEVCEARLADKNASMQELADRLHISKSCINHRMRKIMEMANSLGGEA